MTRRYHLPPVHGDPARPDWMDEEDYDEDAELDRYWSEREDFERENFD
jgi:hypothetical protein